MYIDQFKWKKKSRGIGIDISKKAIQIAIKMQKLFNNYLKFMNISLIILHKKIWFMISIPYIKVEILKN